MIRQVHASELAERFEQGESLAIVDVRTPEEYAEAHVPDSQHIPLDTLADSTDELPNDRTLYLICRSGGRSETAGKWLAQLGYDVVNVAGGILAWTGPVNTAPED